MSIITDNQLPLPGLRRYSVCFFENNDPGAIKLYRARNKFTLKQQLTEDGKLGLLKTISVYVKSKEIWKRLKPIFPKKLLYSSKK